LAKRFAALWTVKFYQSTVTLASQQKSPGLSTGTFRFAYQNA
jgi:hypothetical protein